MTDAPTPPQPALNPISQAVSLLTGLAGLLRIHGNEAAAAQINKEAASIRALQAECDALRDKAADVVINYAMGWEMDGVMDALSAALDAWSKGTQK